jgi:hypothetical protein
MALVMHGYLAMVRELTVLAVLGATFIASGGPAAGAVSRAPDARAGAARQDRPSEAEQVALDHLLERSGLRVQLESLSAGVRVQFLRGGRLNGQDRLTIDRIVSERFAADALYARIRLEFERRVDGAKLAKALEWYDSPLGRRITGLELAALVSNGEPDADLDAKGTSLWRVALLERLDAGGAASETTVDITMAIVRSLTRAFQPVLPAVARLSSSQLEAEFTQIRTRALEQIRRACMVTMLFAYRELSDGELDQYVQFVESEAGQWHMSAMNSTLLTAIDAAAEATAAQLVTAVPELVGDPR